MAAISSIFYYFKFETVICVVALLLVILLFLDNYYRIKFSKKYTSKHMPCVPLLGSAHLFLVKNFLHVLLEWSAKFKQPYYFRLGFIEHYFTQDVDDIKEVLTNPKTIEKGYAYSFLQWIAPNNIVIVKEEIWKKKRRCFSKAFNQRKLNSLVPIFDENSTRVIDQLKGENKMCLLEIIQRNVLENYLETMIGLDITKADEHIRKRYIEVDAYKYTQMIESSAFRRYFKPWLFFDFIYQNTNEARELSSKMMEINRFVDHIITERRCLFNSRLNEHIDEVDKNLVDLMIEENVDEKDMMVEVSAFAAGATETTGTGLGMALTLLGMYPDIQEKVYQEVMDVTGSKDTLDYNDLVKLTYLEMVINEAMRLFPPVAMIMRKATADIALGGKVIPRGINIMISIIDVHHSEKYWTDPKIFDPDRFSPDNSRHRRPFTFLPFSGGPRNCIAVKFAMMLMKTLAANIIKKFKISSENESLDAIKFEQQFTTVITQGMNCTFTPREQH